MNVFTLQPHQIAEQWYWIEPILRRVEDPVWGCEDVLMALTQSHAQLWGFSERGVTQGIVVTRLGTIGDTPSGLIWIAAGENIGGFIELLRSHIEPWMRSKRCRVVEINGRRGWKKLLPDYTERTTVFAKEL